MAWPTTSNVKAEYNKLNHDELDAKIVRAITRAVNVIKLELGECYDVSGWADATPPLLYDVAMQLIYGETARLVHAAGGNLSSSDEGALEARKSAMETLDRLKKGAVPLLDSDDVPIARTCAPSRLTVRRTRERMFTPDIPENWCIQDVDRTVESQRFSN